MLPSLQNYGRFEFWVSPVAGVAENRLRRAFGQGLDPEVVTGEMFRQLVGQLAERQAQVLILYALEFTDSGIGKVLGLAPATVRSHRRHLVNYANRTERKARPRSPAHR
jgi:DNA-binding NarL/FixJ family response regulator